MKKSQTITNAGIGKALVFLLLIAYSIAGNLSFASSLMKDPKAACTCDAGPDQVLSCTNPLLTLSASTSIKNGVYLWVASNGGVIVSGANTLNPVVNAAGTYTLTVTDPLTGCVATDVVIVTKVNIQVDAGLDQVLSCQTPQITLQGSTNISGGIYLWVASNGGVIVSGSNTLNPVISAAGTYTLTIKDPVTGCSATDIVVVTDLRVNVVVNAGGNKEITNCLSTRINLKGSTNLTAGVYLWEASNGGVILSGANSLEVTVGAAGTYKLTVKDPLTGCLGTDVAVVTDIKANIIVNAGSDRTLTCDNPQITLKASANISGGIFSWVASNGGNIVSGANTADNVVVNAAGLYTVTVKDPLTGCVGMDVIKVVNANINISVNGGGDKQLTCLNTRLVLKASTSITGGIFLWTASNGGNIVSGANTLDNCVINAAGIYTITVKDPATGCLGTDVIRVTDNSVKIIVDAGGNQQLTCTNSQLKLKASVNISGGIYQWTASNGGNILSGANTLDNCIINLPGTYTLKVTDPATGCLGIDVVTVVNASVNISVNAGADQQLTCLSSQITLKGSTNISGGIFLWTASNGGSIVSGANSLNAVVNAAGTYTLSVKDPVTGCIGTDIVKVIDGSLKITVNAGGDKQITCANPQVTLKANISVKDAICLWTASNGGVIVSGATSLNAVVSAAGTYTLTVKDPASGCIGTDIVVVTVLNTDVKVNAGADQVLTCAAPKITLKGSVNITGGSVLWTASNGGVIVSGATSLNAEVSAAGTYTLTVTDLKTGCIGTDIVVVTNLNTDVKVDAGVDQVLTCASPKVVLKASVNINGGIALWTASNGGVIISGATSLNAEVNAAGTYTLTVTDPKTGCIGVDVVVVTNLNTDVRVNAGIDQVLTCANPKALLKATVNIANGIYLWTASNGGVILSGATSATAEVNAAGTYTVTVKDPLTGCIGTDVVVVIRANTDVTVDAGGDKVLTCASPKVTLKANVNITGGIILWTASGGGNILSGANTLNAEVDAAGTYTLTVTDPKTGCIGVDVVVVTKVNTDVTVDAGADQVLTCVNPRVTLKAKVNITGCIYLWTASNGGVIVSGAGTANAEVSAAGTYTLTVTNPLTGCVGIDVVVVTQVNTDVTVDAGLDQVLTCVLPKITLKAKTNISGGIFLWTASNGGVILSGANTLDNAVVNAPGTYTLTVTNPVTGCIGVDVVIVTRVNTDVSVDAGADQVLTCTSPKVILKANTNITGGIYLWTASGGGNILSGANTLNAEVNAEGTYTLTVTNPLTGCIGVDVVVVTRVNTEVNVNAGIDQVLTCVNTKVILKATTNIIGGVYLWTASGGGNILSGANTLSPEVNAAGTYTLTVTNPLTGCIGVDVVVVTRINTDVTVDAGPDQVLTCVEKQITLKAKTNLTAGVFLWTAMDGGSIVSGANTLDNCIVNTAGKYILTITNPLTGCIGIDTVVVIRVNTDVSVDAGADQTITCENPKAILRATTNITGGIYLWVASNGGVIVSGANTLTAEVSAAGTYTLTVTNPLTGCIGVDVVVVTRINTGVTVNAGADQVITCENPKVTLKATTNITNGVFLWTASGGGVIVSGANTLNAVVSAAGTYTLTVTNPLTGCIGVDVVIVTQVNTGVTVDAGSDQVISCLSPRVTLTAKTNITNGIFLWTASNGGVIVSGNNTLTAVVSAPGTYTLKVTNPLNGCFGIDVVCVTQVNTDVKVDAGPDKVITCAQPQVTLLGTTNITGGIILWTASNGGVIVSGANTLNAVVKAAGTYTLTIKDPNTGCFGSDIAIVTGSVKDVMVSAGPDQKLSCVSPKVTLSGSTNILGGVVQWTASNGGVIVSGANSLTVVVSAAGTYTLTVKDSRTGCLGTDIAVVTGSGTDIKVNAGPDKTLSCDETTVTLSGSTNLRTAVYTWTASNGGVIVSGANTLNPVVKAVGVYMLTVKDSLSGCLGSDVVLVTGCDLSGMVDAGPDMMLSCTAAQVMLKGTTGITDAVFEWTAIDGGRIVSGANTLNAIVDMAGTYMLSVKNPLTGCMGADIVQVKGTAGAIRVDAGLDRVLDCLNPLITLVANVDASLSSYSVLWTSSKSGAIVSANNTLSISVKAATTLTVTIKDLVTGCTASDEVVVTSNLLTVKVDAGPNKILSCDDPQLVLTASSNVVNGTYLWEASNGGSIVSGANTLTACLVNNSGTYKITVKDLVSGCSATDEVTVKIKGSKAVCSLKIYPNPSSRGKINIDIEGVDNIKQEVSIDIFDMAGKMVYTEKAHYQNNKKLTVINIDEKFVAGTYMVKIKLDGKTYNQKLVIQN